MTETPNGSVEPLRIIPLGGLHEIGKNTCVFEYGNEFDRTKTRTVRPRDVVKVGKHFSVEFIRNTHSIADSFSLAITTPVGVIVFTGDFKFDHTPVDGERFDLHRLAQYGEKGVLCLLSDSTNAELTGFTPPERAVFPNLDRHIAQAEGRVLVTTFASSVHRVSMILELALKHGRRVGLLGRSMLNVIAKARELGYIRCPDDIFLTMKQLRDLPDRELLLLMTGSQGEHLAALSRIARAEHPHVQLKTTDTVIFSASPIPGNTIAVVNVIDQLMMQGATVIYGKDKGIHVSGHGSQEDEKLMLALTRPRFFVPVHGEHRMLVQHCKTARSMGMPAERMLVIENGDVVELTPASIRRGEPVKAGIELLDSSRKGVINTQVLKERQQLAEDGVLVAHVSISSAGHMGAPTRVTLRGVAASLAPRHFANWADHEVQWVLDNRWQQLCRGEDDLQDVDWVGLQREVELGLQRRLRRELEVAPLIIVVVQPTPKGSTAVYKAPATEEKGSLARPGRGGSLPNGVRPLQRNGSANGQSRNPALTDCRRLGADSAIGAMASPSTSSPSALASPGPEVNPNGAGSPATTADAVRTRRSRSRSRASTA